MAADAGHRGRSGWRTGVSLGPWTQLEETSGRVVRGGCLGSLCLFVVCAVWQILQGPVYWLLVVAVVLTSVAELARFLANIPATRERERAAGRSPSDAPPPIEPR